jgi:primosomal protein N' (replication factor Y)
MARDLLEARSMSQVVCYVEVAPFAPVRGRFTYELAVGQLEGESLLGSRVLIPFGRRTVVGVIVGVARDSTQVTAHKIKRVSALLDREPAVPSDLLQLLCWAADYYFASLGELIRAALPPALHARQRRSVRLSVAGREVLTAHEAVLRRCDLVATEQEVALLRRIDSARSGMSRLSAERHGGAALLRRLVERGWVDERDSRREPTKQRTELLVSVCVDAQSAAEVLRRAPRQAQLFSRLLACSQPVVLRTLPDLPHDAKSVVRKLAERGLVRIDSMAAPRDPFASEPVPKDVSHQLTSEQDAAVTELVAAERAGHFAAFLLHGVTGSGKTEVYLRLIASALEAGKSALVLVPEIALTPQLAARFRARFGENVAVMHSGLSESERYEQWCRIRNGRVQIVVGARSAVFAPLQRLGVVIVDEEHDSSFKQEEGVRYHARDLSLVRAQRASAVAVLGSATPALESFWGVQSGRLKRIEMRKRATSNPLPGVEVIDLRRYRPDADGMLSAPLRQAIGEAIAQSGQVILFLNRRGFSTFVLCKGCGHAFQCVNCSVSLTYHRGRERLICHYCGHSEAIPHVCSACGSERVELLGSGTQKVEDALQRSFPTARVGRLDRDTASGGGLRRVLAQVQRGELDILVGTQMVTKGHDFPGVTLVGVLCADLGLQFPDFRASERTFQLLTQVAGRSGRGEIPGRVLIQTYSPDHAAIEAACRHDYERFCAVELASRKETNYPPVVHVAAFHIDGERAEAVVAGARQLARHARSMPELNSDVTLLGPAEAPIQRLKGRTRWMLLLKATKRRPLRQVVHRLLELAESVCGGARVAVDVDPVQML